MSQWTHVNASIRFDGITSIDDTIISEKDLGIIETWENDKETDFIPCGSEGSIEYKIIETGSENSLACRAVIFTGDLRDYDNVDEIIEYFYKITKDKMIRSGILEIWVEGQEPIVFRFANKRWYQFTL